VWLFVAKSLRFGASDDRRGCFHQFLNRSIVGKGWANGDYQVESTGSGEILERLQRWRGSAAFESSNGRLGGSHGFGKLCLRQSRVSSNVVCQLSKLGDSGLVVVFPLSDSAQR
jgi:hypothetical protein